MEEHALDETASQIVPCAQWDPCSPSTATARCVATHVMGFHATVGSQAVVFPSWMSSRVCKHPARECPPWPSNLETITSRFNLCCSSANCALVVTGRQRFQSMPLGTGARNLRTRLPLRWSKPTLKPTPFFWHHSTNVQEIHGFLPLL